MKFFSEVGCAPRTNRLDFGGIADRDLDPGFLNPRIRIWIHKFFYCPALLVISLSAKDISIVEATMSCMILCSQNHTIHGEGAVDLENDGHKRPITDFDDRVVTVRSPGLTQEQKNEAVEYHNKLREQEGSSNMEMLVRSVTCATLVNFCDRTFACQLKPISQL